MQLRFTPELKRRAQLAAAEKLFALIEDEKQYPYDFVCFQITGYKPSPGEHDELIAGADLREDLHVFLTKLSGKLATRVDEAGEKVYSADEVAARFQVSAKTVGRWRKRGLLARKFIFSDGIRRVGFLASSVERFVREQPDLVDRARRFRRFTTRERQQAVRQARALAAKSRLSRYQIIEQVAAKLDMAHETVRTILQDYEGRHPDRPVFRRPLGRIQPAQAAELFRLYRQGVPVRHLMERFDRSRATIHRIVNQRRAMALLAAKVEFVHSEEFEPRDAGDEILRRPLPHRGQEEERKLEPFDLVGENLLPEYMQVLKMTPVLTREEEIELFRRYNYLKFRFCRERGEVKLSRVSAGRLSRLESYLEQAEEIRKLLVEANLRLVVSIAGKHTNDRAGFLELVSKGNLALIQAVEEYDYTTGFRFSRQASMRIAKEYARVSGRSTELTPKRVASLASVQRDLRATTADIFAIERTRHSLAEVIRQELDEREQQVILQHFGLTGASIRKSTRTLKQIGDELGLTKERVRQIELQALQKLRQCLSPEQFEMLTG
jgi:RNA polymerase sigma factor (sigma-70 family)